MTITEYTNALAGLFPAFGSRMSGGDRQFIDDHPEIIDTLLAGRERLLPGGRERLVEHLTAGGTHELRAQVATYLVSCSAADYLHARGIRLDAVSGYSMGIYGALYATGAVAFPTGLRLIEEAYALVVDEAATRDYVNGIIVGLTVSDCLTLMGAESPIEITNRNNPHSLVVTGPREAVIGLLDAARTEGALTARLLDFGAPYHHRVLARSAEYFSSVVARCEIGEARCPVVSSIDQRFLTAPGDLARELAENLATPLDWHTTMQTMLDHGITRYVECGPGTSLEKCSRFTGRQCAVYTLGALDQLEAAVAASGAAIAR